MVTDSVKLLCEYTDTFGGEANYCWVKRAELTIPIELSDRAITRRAKAALGLTGVKGRTHSYGDAWEFRPYGGNTVAFWRVEV